MTQSGSQKELYDRILKSADYINRIGRSGAANYIITSQQISDTIRDILKDRNISRILKIKKIWLDE
jgi:hypothetical protein